MKGEMIIKKFTPEHISDILRRIDVNDEDTIEFMDDYEEVADLGLSVDETLLIQLQGHAVIRDNKPVGDRITNKVDPKYKHCFLTADTNGGFTDYDVESNGISDARNDVVPTFVKDYEKLLIRKRKVAPNLDMFVEMIFENEAPKSYFCSTTETSESSPIVNRPEVDHLFHLLSVEARWWQSLNPSKENFKECDADWLFFSAVARHYDTLPSIDDKANVTVKR
ncbi:hypothetical protein EI94DRAFT_473465 [Lactarius quietus]|nr:hypothetical protein EI94DRAFT_473465 [Lactarius quietus]